MNSSKPIWTKKPKEVTDDEYNEFYKAMAKVRMKSFGSYVLTVFFKITQKLIEYGLNGF